MSLAAATRSEFTKLFTTALWWVLGLVLVLYLGLTATGLGFVLSATTKGLLPGQTHGVPVPASGLAPVLYSMASSIGYVFPLLIGTLLVTGEFRHRTLTPTFLATPRRGLVLGGKVTAGAVIGVLYAVLALVVSVGPAAAFLSGFGIDTRLGDADTWAMLGRIVLAFVLWALIGVGVGALVRNQVAAIVIVLAFTQFVEPIARLVGTFVDAVRPVADVLPATASDALVGSSLFTTLGAGSATTLDWWGGALVLLAYAVVLIVLGHAVGWRRDVS